MSAEPVAQYPSILAGADGMKRFPKEVRRGEPLHVFYGSQGYISILCLLVWRHLKRWKIGLVPILFYGLSASQAQNDSSLLPNKRRGKSLQGQVFDGKDHDRVLTNLYIFQCAGRIVWGEECIFLLNAQEEVTSGFRDDTFSTYSSPAAMISMDLVHRNPLRTSLSCI